MKINSLNDCVEKFIIQIKTFKICTESMWEKTKLID